MASLAEVGLNSIALNVAGLMSLPLMACARQAWSLLVLVTTLTRAERERLWVVLRAPVVGPASSSEPTQQAEKP